MFTFTSLCMLIIKSLLQVDLGLTCQMNITLFFHTYCSEIKVIDRSGGSLHLYCVFEEQSTKHFNQLNTPNLSMVKCTYVSTLLHMDLLYIIKKDGFPTKLGNLFSTTVKWDHVTSALKFNSNPKEKIVVRMDTDPVVTYLHFFENHGSRTSCCTKGWSNHQAAERKSALTHLGCKSVQ